MDGEVELCIRLCNNVLDNNRVCVVAAQGVCPEGEPRCNYKC